MATGVVVAMGLAGCAVFTILLSDNEFIIIQAGPTPTTDRVAAAAVTLQVLGIVDHVASAHHLHRLDFPGATPPSDPETYLRRYGNAVMSDHYQVALLVQSGGGEKFPTIFVQGSTAGGWAR